MSNIRPLPFSSQPFFSSNDHRQNNLRKHNYNRDMKELNNHSLRGQNKDRNNNENQNANKEIVFSPTSQNSINKLKMSPHDETQNISLASATFPPTMTRTTASVQKIDVVESKPDFATSNYATTATPTTTHNPSWISIPASSSSSPSFPSLHLQQQQQYSVTPTNQSHLKSHMQDVSSSFPFSNMIGPYRGKEAWGDDTDDDESENTSFCKKNQKVRNDSSFVSTHSALVSSLDQVLKELQDDGAGKTDKSEENFKISPTITDRYRDDEENSSIESLEETILSDVEEQNQKQNESGEKGEEDRVAREQQESEELARQLMAEEAMASYSMSTMYLQENPDNLSEEHLAALRFAMMEEVEDEDDYYENDNHHDNHDNDNHDGLENGIIEEDLSYEAMLRLGEQIGDVKEERWAMIAKDQIEKLPLVKHSLEYVVGKDKNDSACKCLICQFSYEKEEQLRILPCGHRFHAECVDQWLSKKDFCPYCRQSIVD